VDLFDKPLTCRKVWDRLLTGVILDALEVQSNAAMTGDSEVQRAMVALQAVSWQKAEAVGAGEEYRGEPDAEQRHASALVCHGAIVHASLVAG
jgi:hypothetical protein